MPATLTVLAKFPGRDWPFLRRWRRNIADGVMMLRRAYRSKTPARARRLRTHIRARRQSSPGLLPALAWWIRLLTKSLDVLAAGELYNCLGLILKPNARPLTPVEEAEARRVFHDSLPYEHVHVDERSLLAWLGACFRFLQTGRLKPLGVVVAYTINFTRPLRAAPGNEDMAWLIHELAHVAQMECVGLQYYPEAIYAQFTAGYDLKDEDLSHCHLCDFNREQQGEIVRAYYRRLWEKSSCEEYDPLIDELRRGLV